MTKFVIHAADIHQIADGFWQLQATDPAKPRMVLTLQVSATEGNRALDSLLHTGGPVEMDFTEALTIVGARALQSSNE
jgi:hypothetical protein